MKALIIEDETAAALNLAAVLRQVAPGVEVVATLESVAESIEWLRANPQPDLLFMDIHLADGDSFRISSRWRSPHRSSSPRPMTSMHSRPSR